MRYHDTPESTAQRLGRLLSLTTSAICAVLVVLFFASAAIRALPAVIGAGG